MRLVLFRHAEKQHDGTANPKLSAYGAQQALKLAQDVSVKNLPTPQVLMASPRIRTQQTLSPLAQNLGLKVSIYEPLNERLPNESVADFRRRIQELLVHTQMDYQKNECVYLCTHYDWIEEFLTIIECNTDLTKYSQWSSAQWLWLDKKELWEFVKFDHVKV